MNVKFWIQQEKKGCVKYLQLFSLRGHDRILSKISSRQIPNVKVQRVPNPSAISLLSTQGQSIKNSAFKFTF